MTENTPDLTPEPTFLLLYNDGEAGSEHLSIPSEVLFQEIDIIQNCDPDLFSGYPDHGSDIIEFAATSEPGDLLRFQSSTTINTLIIARRADDVPSCSPATGESFPMHPDASGDPLCAHVSIKAGKLVAFENLSIPALSGMSHVPPSMSSAEWQHRFNKLLRDDPPGKVLVVGPSPDDAPGENSSYAIIKTANRTPKAAPRSQDDQNSLAAFQRAIVDRIDHYKARIDNPDSPEEAAMCQVCLGLCESILGEFVHRFALPPADSQDESTAKAPKPMVAQYFDLKYAVEDFAEFVRQQMDDVIIAPGDDDPEARATKAAWLHANNEFDSVFGKHIVLPERSF